MAGHRALHPALDRPPVKHPILNQRGPSQDLVRGSQPARLRVRVVTLSAGAVVGEKVIARYTLSIIDGDATLADKAVSFAVRTNPSLTSREM